MAKSLSVAVLTPWDIRCGISIYTERLVEALRRRGHRVRVLAETAPDSNRRFEATERDVLRCWSRNQTFGGAIEEIAAMRPDIVFFSHEWSYASDWQHFTHLVSGSHRYGARVVLGLHSVLTTGHPIQSMHSIDGLVVYSLRAQAFLLERNWPPDRVFYIPHGCPEPVMSLPGDVRSGRLAMSGFMFEAKGYNTALDALQVARHHVSATLDIYGATNETTRQHSEDCLRRLAADVRTRSLSDVVSIWSGFPAESGLMRSMASADILLLLYSSHANVLSASAGLTLALSVSRPVITTDIAHFEGPDALIRTQVRVRDAHEAGEQIARLLLEPAYYREMACRAHDYALSRPFSMVAGEYECCFRRLLESEAHLWEQESEEGLLGVVVRTGGHFPRLHRALASIPADGRLRVVVVADHECERVRDAVQREFPSVWIYDGEGKGASFARHLGVQHCRTRYIKFLDDDDVLLPGWAEEAAAIAIRGTEWAALGIATLDHGAPAITPLWPTVEPSQLLVNRDTYLQVVGVDSTASGSDDFDLSECMRRCGVYGEMIPRVYVLCAGNQRDQAATARG